MQGLRYPRRTSFGLLTATSVVIANMVGSGVLTSIAFQVGALKSAASILLLWGVGGVVALTGAVCYSELGRLYRESGGEYLYLGRTLHPALGFAAGWVSMLLGFSAPSAAAALALAHGVLGADGLSASAGTVVTWTPLALAASVSTVVVIIHATRHEASAILQVGSTALKIGVIGALIVGGALHGAYQPVSFAPSGVLATEVLSPAFAAACYFVTYAYSGWNGVSYIAGEISPPRNVQRSILLGTSAVILLYLLLNATFLLVLPTHEIAGRIDVAVLLGLRLFGGENATMVRVAIALLFLSGISAMMLGGSRVTAAIAADVPALRWAARTGRTGLPVRALMVQLALVLFFLATASFERLIVVSGFTLTIFTTLTVLGLLRALQRHGVSLRSRPWLAASALFFVAANAWIISYGISHRPADASIGIVAAASGVLAWWLFRPAHASAA